MSAICIAQAGVNEVGRNYETQSSKGARYSLSLTGSLKVDKKRVWRGLLYPTEHRAPDALRALRVTQASRSVLSYRELDVVEAVTRS